MPVGVRGGTSTETPRAARVALRVLLACGLLLPASPVFAAGDVLVVPDPATGVLTITGTDEDEDIEITSAGADDAFVVTGQNGTTVNGLPSVTVAGVSRLIVKMFGGADEVSLYRLRIRSHLNLHGGYGADVLVLDGVQVDGITKVHGGPGDDRVVARDGSRFVRRLMIYTADGNDDIRIEDTHCSNRLLIQAGRGHDEIDLDDSWFENDAEVKADSGNDDLHLDDCEFEEDFTARMSNGRDHVRFEDTDVDDDLELDGGDGDDDELDFRGGNDFDDEVDIWHFED
jgi:hypothetical protein